MWSLDITELIIKCSTLLATDSHQNYKSGFVAFVVISIRLSARWLTKQLKPSPEALVQQWHVKWSHGCTSTLWVKAWVVLRWISTCILHQAFTTRVVRRSGFTNDTSKGGTRLDTRLNHRMINFFGVKRSSVQPVQLQQASAHKRLPNPEHKVALHTFTLLVWRLPLENKENRI